MSYPGPGPIYRRCIMCEKLGGMGAALRMVGRRPVIVARWGVPPN